MAWTRHFEKASTIEPRYDQAIIYSGEVLMVNDPLTGRLMANAFFRLRMAAG